MDTIVCPQCNKDDAIQKVSAIVDSGKSTGSYSGPSTSHVSVDGKSGTSFGYSHLFGSNTTELARLLLPPTKPTNKNEYTNSEKQLGGLIMYAVFGVLIGLLLFVTENKIIGSLIIIGSIIVTPIFVYYFPIDRKQKEIIEANKVLIMQNWENANNRWSRLYYCHRNGIVFDSETGKTCEPLNLKEFLYQSQN